MAAYNFENITQEFTLIFITITYNNYLLIKLFHKTELIIYQHFESGLRRGLK